MAFVSSRIGVFASIYPPETAYPSYSGTILDIGLVYTDLALDRGGVAQLPNNVVMSALVLAPRGDTLHRVRMSLPLPIPVATVESALAEVVAGLGPLPAGRQGARLEVSDISAATWGGVVVVSSPDGDVGELRGRLLRAVLARLPGVGTATSRPVA